MDGGSGETSPPARASGSFAIGGELSGNRLGLGAMRLPGMMSDLASPIAARELLREAVRLGIDLIDTAHAYGRSEEMIAEALHPYPEGLVIATKGGLGPGGQADGRPERLRADCELSLRRLRLDTIDLWSRADARRQSARSATCAPTRTRPSPRRALLRRPSSLGHALRLLRTPQARGW
jgi:pyridoxine 4-dehydrogenase